jgi:hypothetical protein
MTKRRADAALRRSIAALGLGLALALAARADVVYLRSGGKVEGVVVSDAPDAVKVKTRFGVQTIARSDVDRIEKKETPEQVYAKRLAALRGDDVAGLLELAQFCKEKDLVAEWKATLEKVIAADPKNAEAQTALGRVEYEGAWITPAEKAAREKQKDVAAKRAAGLVEYQGRWVSKEEKEALEKGLVQVDGKWVTEAEAMTKQGLVNVGGKWVRAEEQEAIVAAKEASDLTGATFCTETTARFTIVSAGTPANAKEVGVALEKGLARFLEVFAPKIDPLDGKRMFVLLLESKEDYEKYCEFFGKKFNLGPGWAKVVRVAGGFYHYQPCASVDFRGGRTEKSLVNSSVHKLGHVLINRHHFGYNYVPAWLDEGFAAWLEHEVLKQNLTYCFSTSYGQYGGGGNYGNEKAAGKTVKIVGNEPTMKDVVRMLVGSGKDRPLQALLPLDLPEIGFDETSKAANVIDFLIREDATKFDRFLERMRSRMPHFETKITPGIRSDVQMEALQAIYGTGPAEIDARWRAAVKRGD